MNSLPELAPAASGHRQPYRPPELKCYGDIQSMTKTTVAKTMTPDGGGGAPFNKTAF